MHGTRSVARPLRLVPYDPEWAERFAHEALRLRGAISTLLVDLQHVGSTSVPGLISKPVIDISGAVGSDRDADACIAPLETLGYEHRGPHGDDPRRRYYVRDVDGARLFQLHLYVIPAEAWHEKLAFRDALRRDPGLVAEYAAEKARVATLTGFDKARYSEEKGPFIRRVLARIADAPRQ